MIIFDTVFLGNSLREWLLAVTAGSITFLVLIGILRVLLRRAAVLASRTATHWDDIVVHAFSRTHALFIPVLALSAAVATLDVPPRFRSVVQAIAVLALLFQVGLWLSAGFSTWLQRYSARELGGDQAATTTMGALAFVVRLVLWSVVLLVALDNLGIDVTALITGLGVGGIAVALAAQNILGDLFASLSIVLDKPFVIGDFVVIDEYRGNVEYIGLKTTRVRSLSGEQLVFSNSDLLKSRLRNFRDLMDRRVVFQLGVAYETPREKLVNIPQIIREAVAEQQKTRFDRSHFRAYGDFALIFETVYYVLSREYNDYMDIQHAINLRIGERFDAEGIRFAYPTQKLYLARESLAQTMS